MPCFRFGNEEREQQAEGQGCYADAEGGDEGSAAFQPLFGEPGADHLGEAVEGDHRGGESGPLVGVQGTADALGEQYGAEEGAADQSGTQDQAGRALPQDGRQDADQLDGEVDAQGRQVANGGPQPVPDPGGGMVARATISQVPSSSQCSSGRLRLASKGRKVMGSM